MLVTYLPTKAGRRSRWLRRAAALVVAYCGGIALGLVLFGMLPQ